MANSEKRTLKKTLQKELNIKVPKKEDYYDSAEEPEHQPTTTLEEQTMAAVNQYFNEREQFKYPVADVVEDTLESDGPVVAPVAPRGFEYYALWDNDGIRKGRSRSRYVGYRDGINAFGGFAGNNYNALGMKSSAATDYLLTREEVERGMINPQGQYVQVKHGGHISKAALVESLGYPGMRKY